MVAATLGAGTLTFPYAVMKNGILLGPLLIILGAAVSYYTGMLLVKCSEHTKKHRYEDYALALYGPRMALATSIINLLTLIGFITSYIVYVLFICNLLFFHLDKNKST